MPDAELRLTIMSSIAQDEVRKLSERVKFGFKRSIEQGVVLGNNKIWGYRKDNGKLVIVEEEAQIVRQIFDLYATQNLGIRTVANRLNELGYRNTNGKPFSFTTVAGIIRNPKYKGYYCGNKSHKYDYMLNDIKKLDESEWVLYKDEETVPPIVSEEIWERANRIYQKRSARHASDDRTSYQNKYRYSGKILCLDHKEYYYRSLYRYASGNREVWHCKLYSEKGRVGCPHSPILYTTELDEVMQVAYGMLVSDRSKIIEDLVAMYGEIMSRSSIQEEIAQADENISQIMKRKDKLLDLSLDGKISDAEFQSRNEEFNRQIGELRLLHERLTSEKLQNEDMADSVDALRKIITKELDFSDGFSATTIDALLERIEVSPTTNKKSVQLKVYFKVLDETIDFQVVRGKKGNISVCCTPST